PHLLALTAADTAAHVARRRRSDRAALGMAALSAVGLAALIGSAHRARDEVDDALAEALGSDYRSALVPPSHPGDLATPWRQLVLPFRMRNPEVRRKRNVAYARGGKRFLADIYTPRTPRRDCPVLLQVHGGGWMVGTKDQQGVPLMLHMAARGWVCVAINYPLSPKAKWPAHIVAAKQALAWVRQHIADYGGDPSFVATTGGSAGGHLSALLALTPNDPEWQPGFTDVDTSVQACVPHYGAYDFAAQTESRAAKVLQRTVLERYVVGQDPREYRDVYVAASPLARITADAPPFFVIHGKHDSLIPVADAREFVRRLRATSSQPVAYAEISGAQHAFDIFPSIRSAHVARGVQRFLEWAYARHVGAASRVASPAGARLPH
ncbi:MAG: alpha/beta hydrolase fold domain-containing protein, partial [Haloechinothrix sp.]